MKIIYPISILGGTMALLNMNVQASAESFDTKSQVEFVPSGENSPILNPLYPDCEKPQTPIGGGTKDENSNGDFTIDFASSFDFGMNKISNQDALYFAQAQEFEDMDQVTPDFIQVTDNRGTLAGWTLKVKQTNQFTSTSKTQHAVLDGATLSFLNPQTATCGSSIEPETKEIINLVPTQEAMVAEARVGAGAATWAIRWGDEKDITKLTQQKVTSDKKLFSKAVQLFVPGETVKDAVTYKTTLLWSLSELPKNN